MPRQKETADWSKISRRRKEEALDIVWDSALKRARVLDGQDAKTASAIRALVARVHRAFEEGRL